MTQYNKFDLKTDSSRDSKLTAFGKATLTDRYLLPEEDFQGMFVRVASAFADDAAHAQRLYDYISQLWFMPATPVLSNGGTNRGMPISCYLNETDDSLKGIVDLWNENVWLASRGGGIGSYWGNLRSIGEKVRGNGKTSGVIPFMRVQDSLTLAISQGCCDGNTEVLTENGWVKFSVLNKSHGKILEITDDKEMRFVDVEEYHAYPYKGILHHYTNPGNTVDHLVTPNHRMCVEKEIKKNGKRVPSGKLEEVLSEAYNPHRDNRLYVSGVSTVSKSDERLSYLEKFLIAYQADGSAFPVGSSNGNTNGCLAYNFRFSKIRKIERFRAILANLDFVYSENLQKDQSTSFYVSVPMTHKMVKDFSWVKLTEISSLKAKDFIAEIALWDGSSGFGKNFIRYDNTNLKAADMVSAIACLAGYKAFISTLVRPEPRQPLHKVFIHSGKITIGGESISKTETHFEGEVYCVTVPSGRFLARKNGRILVTGNSLRRGSSAVYMPIDHPEIEEFIDIRRPTGGDHNRKTLNIHHGVTISDEFMNAVENDEEWGLRSPKTREVLATIKARDLWIKLLLARIETGEPYMLFIDNVNNHIPEHHKKLGLKVKTSNLCVAPETKILTPEGYVEIQERAGQLTTIWNGLGWSEVTVTLTSENSELLKVNFSDGSILECTEYHKFYIQDLYDKKQIQVKRTADLRPGDILQEWALPTQEASPTLVKDVRVVSVEKTGRTDKTYCFTENKRGRGTFNDVVTGNCSEITLPTGYDHLGNSRTAVCCLSSLNLETYEEWKDHPQMMEDVMRFLDNVLQDFIDTAAPEMARAIYAAERERSVGLGVMGFHSFLQKKSVPFESVMAKSWNKRIFTNISDAVEAASVKLAHERGACPDAAECDIQQRFTNKTAIAPTASISIIAGNSSPGIEPYAANVFTQKTLSGSFSVRNKHLKDLLEQKGQDNEEVWNDIARNEGSVYHLNFLSEHEKDVFKTAQEIDQYWVIEHAADRTPFITQAQSVNLFLPADIDKRDLHQLHFKAWKRGVKSLYYCRSTSLQRSEKVSNQASYSPAAQIPPSAQTGNYEECLACQ